MDIKKVYPVRKILIPLGITLGYGYFVLANSLILRPDYTAQLGSLLLSAAAVIGWLVLRHRQGLPRTGLEIGVLIFYAAVLAALCFSPDVRIGFEPYASLVRLELLFYLAVDAFSCGLGIRTVLGPVMLVSGLISAAAAGEVLAWFQGWSVSTGGQGGFPEVTYRVITLLGHSNTYMGYMNFLFPLVLVYWFTRRTPAAFFGMTLWLVFFLVTIPFTSSRGGLLGLGAGIGVLLVFWAWQKKFWLALGRLSRQRRRLALGVGGGAVLALGGAGLFMLNWFARHPTHGDANIFGSREALWASAVEIWQKSPWVGVGLNRYAFEYLLESKNYPPGFWAGHAHSFTLQTLAESGLVGFAALALVFCLFAGLGWKAYRRLAAADQLWGAAVLAGLASGLVFSIPENTWSNPYLLTAAVIFSAWLFARGGLARFTSIKMPVLGLGLLLAGGLTAFGLWGYQPYAAGLEAAEAGDLTGGLALVREAQRRDPGLALYPQQAGLLLAEDWAKTGSAQALDEGRLALGQFLALEPSQSLWWADKAVLDWAAGKAEDARRGMVKAAEMAPAEATYPLNLGWFQEQAGLAADAQKSYQRVLELQPEWACHPFWQGSALRQALVAQIDCRDPFLILTSLPHLQRAHQLLLAGELSQAWIEIQRGQGAGELPQAALVLTAQYYQAAGMADKALETRQELARQLARPALQDWYVASAMSMAVYQRKVLNREIVPGYLKLAPEAGQGQELLRLAEDLKQAGQAGEAAKIEELGRMILAGGVLRR